MATVKFDHAVIYDGVLYPANTEITVKEQKDKEEVVTENDKGTGRKSKSRNKAD